MKPATKLKLQEAELYCNEHDKSTEFMLQYMQDYAGVDLDCVLNYFDKAPHWSGSKNKEPKNKKSS